MAPNPTLVLHLVSTASSVIFLSILSIKAWKYGTSGIQATVNWKRASEAALGVLLAAILLSHWSEISDSESEYKTALLLSTLTSILSSLGLCLLFLQEHRWSQHTSDVTTLHLLTAIICDALHLILSPSVPNNSRPLRPVLFTFFVRFALFVSQLSTSQATSALSTNQSPEDIDGVLSRAFFIWVNPILIRGYQRVLAPEDVPSLNHDMKPQLTREAILEAWAQRIKPETQKTLPLVLLECLKRPFFAAVIPRLLMIIFTYAQPILIKKSIKYAAKDSVDSGGNEGFWLITSALIIYIGLALSTASYRHRISKLKLMTRSALVGLIHNHTMKSPSIAYDNGEATTLMSSDADNLDGIAGMVHDTWAQVVEVVIGIALLASQVGWIWPLLLFLIYLCSHMSRFVAKHLRPHQKSWNTATQNRMAATSSMLSGMKTVKMVGFQRHLSDRIQQLRKMELVEASKLRWVNVYYNASANALGIFSPAITLVIFAIISAARGNGLDTETAFTTMAILGMVTHPANMVMTIVPRAVAAFSGFERIQEFLLRKPLEDFRGGLPEHALDKFHADSQPDKTKSTPVIDIRELQIGSKQPILQRVSLKITPGSLTILSGPTGSGKSTLLRAVLGEVVPAHGSISVSTQRIAYCAQRPWLPNGTIKEAIYGSNRIADVGEKNERWYQEVIKLCSLTHDLDSMPDGDKTQIGSRGLNLSGGQRQRVTLARALFARCDILLLDDTFSGLDGDTEQTVFNNLFGPTGITRQLKTTVFLVSNSTQYFQAADHIVVLGDGGIVDQGNWQSIKVKAASIEKFSAGDQMGNQIALSSSFDKLTAQIRRKYEMEQDLSRKSGDLALYRYYLGFIGKKNLSLLIALTAVYSFFITTPQYWLQLWTESGSGSTAYYVGGFLLLSTMSWSSTSMQMWSVVIRLAPESGLRLHARLLHIISSAPLSYFSNTDSGSILNRFSQDIPLMDKQLPSALQTILVQIFKLFMQVIVLCVAEKWLAVSLPPSIVLVYLVQKVYLQTSKQLQFLELEYRAKVFSSFLESIEGLETIRAFGWSAAVIKDNTLSVDHSQRPEFLLICLQRWLKIVLDLFSAALATVAIAIAVTYREHISGAQVGIALHILLVVNSTLIKLVNSWATLETSIGATARLKTLEEKTPVEGTDTLNLDPPKGWPSRGQIEFKNATASYNAESVALQNLNLSIKAGQKLIVCGRTGSGKSSLLLALLRLLELKSGKIELDGIEISRVELELLRERCFIAVSQDPLLLPNETLRFNLDPSASVPDSMLVSSLSKTGLWPHFFESHIDSTTKATIDTTTSSPGEHPILDRKLSLLQELSVGQCQLFALCRALVKAHVQRNYGVKPVVILDEVTSSLDTATESVIHSIIDDEFTNNGHTVIAVSHRVVAFKDGVKGNRDAVVFLANGRLQEA